MKSYAHILSSWRRVIKLNRNFYEKDKRKIFELVKEINLWFDEFYQKKGNDFDYTCYPYDHRAERHHTDGIEECHFLLVNKYGSEYSKIILREASMHVDDDMHYIPEKIEYKKYDFWESWSQRFEWFFNE